jgi:four helix bundle protein
LLRSGTSIGANLAESECEISRSEFFAKIYIALKETAETIYWLDLLYQTDYLTEAQYSSLFHDAEEMRRMLSSSTKTILQNKTPHSTLHTPH